MVLAGLNSRPWNSPSAALARQVSCSCVGTGRKDPTVPLGTTTARTLQTWFRELSGGQTRLAFPSARGRRPTRHGVNYILQQVVERAVATCPSLRDQHSPPHTRRHPTAPHLLQSGVDLAVIAR